MVQARGSFRQCTHAHVAQVVARELQVAQGRQRGQGLCVVGVKKSVFDLKSVMEGITDCGSCWLLRAGSEGRACPAPCGIKVKRERILTFRIVNQYIIGGKNY